MNPSDSDGIKHQLAKIASATEKVAQEQAKTNQLLEQLVKAIQERTP